MCDLRQFRRATRAGLRRHLKKPRFIPMLLRPEFGDRWRYLPKRDRYLPRIGSGNVTRVDVRLYQRAREQSKRQERGWRMCSARLKLSL